MKMDPATRQRVVDHLSKKMATPRPCSLCGANQWQLHDSIFELRDFNEGNLIMGGPVFPVIPLVCSNCGNTLFVNAILASAILLPQQEKEVAHAGK